MSIEEKYPLLIGHSSQGNQELHSIQEVADFICFSEYLWHLY